MGGKRKHFSPEFKVEAVRMLEEGDEPASQVARKLGIRTDVLHRWRREVERGKHGAEPVGGGQESEVERLRRELERVKQERDFLKKAAAYFAHESK